MRKFKVAIAITVICALCMLGLSGCTTEIISDGDESISIDNTNPVFTSIAHGSPNGLWFMLSSGVAECLGRTYEGSLMELSPGDNLPNFLRLNERSIDFGLTLTNTVYTGYNGLGSFDESHENVGGVAIFYPSMLQFIVKKDSGITTFDEFIQNKVPLTLSIGIKGGAAYTALETVLIEYDLTLEDLEDWGCKFYPKGLKETGELFSDGVLDGLWLIAGAPTPAVVQMSLNKEMVMVSFPTSLIELLKENHGFSDYSFPAKSYSFVNNDFDSVCVYTMVTTSLEVSDEIAYKVAKSINENIEYLSEIHSALKNLDSEKLLEGMPIPLHPGAEKYYREVGLID